MTIKRFEDLEIWKLSLEITIDVYNLTNKENFSKDFGLKEQIRRASVSISSNIVEGFEKNNNKEFRRFLSIAKGSLGEVRNQLYIAFAIKYICQEEFELLNNKLINLANQIGKLMTYIRYNLKQTQGNIS